MGETRLSPSRFALFGAIFRASVPGLRGYPPQKATGNCSPCLLGWLCQGNPPHTHTGFTTRTVPTPLTTTSCGGGGRGAGRGCSPNSCHPPGSPPKPAGQPPPRPVARRRQPRGAKIRPSGRQTLQGSVVEFNGERTPPSVCRGGGGEVPSVVTELVLAAQAQKIPAPPPAVTPLSRLSAR